jgi:hypothetical protein
MSSMNVTVDNDGLRFQLLNVWFNFLSLWYGQIRSIRSDRGANFVEEVCKKLLEFCDKAGLDCWFPSSSEWNR